jgi:DNA-binding LacI/PurR family transcriptional regulator
MAALNQRLASMLLDIIENGPEPARHMVFAEELVIRYSCGVVSQ